MKISLTLTLPVILYICLRPVIGQVTTGSISGYVLDPSERAIPSARVSLAAMGQAIHRTAWTDGTGHFRFMELAPGEYTVTASGIDFAEAGAAPVDLAVDSKVRVDLVLALRGSTQSVDVRSRVSTLPAESSELGAVIGRAWVESLPLNRRDFLQLAFLIPGVLPPVEDSELSTRGSFSMHVNGAREEFNNFRLDGVDNNDPDVNRWVLQPPVDAIQEFKVASSTYSAEYGRSAGGQVNVITRSGSNELHGFVYEYLRDRLFDARNFFDGSQKAPYSRSQFGGGGGGPVVKNKTFLFLAYDRLRQRQAITQLGTVPTALMRTGDLSEYGSPAVDPITGIPFPDNRIPVSRIDPLSANIFAMYPMPNFTGTAANLLGQPVGRASQSLWNLRGDHNFSDRDKITLRYSHGSNAIFEPYAESSTGVPGYGDIVTDSGHNGLARYQRLIGLRTVNELTAGFNRAVRSVLHENAGTDVGRRWGVAWLPSRPVDFGYPGIAVAGFSHVGDVGSLPIDRAANTYQLGDTLAISKGSQMWKIGAEVRRIQHNGIADILTRGSLSFSGAVTGNGAADLLLGLPTFGIQSQADNTQTLRYTATNVFVQHDWGVRPNLTLNFGLRYEYNTPPVDPTDRMSILNLETGRLVRVGTNATSRSGVSPDRLNFAPRIGLAWSPFTRTVVRTGYGIYFDSGMLVANTALYFNPPDFTIRVFFPFPGAPLRLSNPFPTDGGYVPPSSLSTLSPHMVSASLQHWNLNLQQDLGRLGILSAACAGSKGTHLLRSRDLNQPAPGPGDISDRVPYQGFSNIFFEESAGNSSFHSLQLMLNRQMTRGVSVLAAYTLSKSIDDTSAFLGNRADMNFPQNSHDYRQERAASSFDSRHRLSLVGVWRLPGHHFRGFQLSGILATNTGLPFTPTLQFDNSNAGNIGGTAGSDRPNVSGDPNSGPRTPERWFNTSVLQMPAQYTFGNAGRNIIRGPGFMTLDISLCRSFRIAERAELRLEGQAFNLTNHVNFNLPAAYVDDRSSFGRIHSARSSRQVQMALRLAF